MNESPKVSIIIPVLNGEKYIAEAIQTALSQDYQNKEVIVVDDGSKDETAKICATFSDKIIYFFQENKGLGVARNQGVHLASGDYFAFLDCDDVWDTAKLSRQMQEADKDSLVFTLIEQFICPTLSEEERSGLVLSTQVAIGYCATCLLISRECFYRIGLFKPTREVGEFIEWYGRAKILSVAVKTINEVLAYRRLHMNNMGRQRERYSRQEYLKVLKNHLKLQRQEEE